MTRDLGLHLPPVDHPCRCGLSLVSHQLSNGARILAVRPTRRADYRAVLAIDEQDVVNPFLTAISDPDGHFSSPRYHGEIGDALVDLEVRAGR